MLTEHGESLLRQAILDYQKMSYPCGHFAEEPVGAHAVDPKTGRRYHSCGFYLMDGVDKYGNPALFHTTERRGSMDQPLRQFVLHPGYVRSASDGETHYIDPHSLLRLYQVRGEERDRAVIAGTAGARGLSEARTVAANAGAGVRELVHLFPDPLGKYDLEHPFDPTGAMPRFQTTEEADAWLNERERIQRIQRGEGDPGEEGRPISAPSGSFPSIADYASRADYIRDFIAASKQPVPIAQPAPSIVHPGIKGFTVDQVVFDEIAAGRPLRSFDAITSSLTAQLSSESQERLRGLIFGPEKKGIDTVTVNGKTYEVRNGEFTDDGGVTFSLNEPPNTIS